jgi:hypothetical protein
MEGNLLSAHKGAGNLRPSGRGGGQNRAKKPYYYWYLKCTGRDKQRSIYLGKSPEGYNTVKNAARAASEAVVVVERFRGVVEELDKALRDLVDKLKQLTAVSAAETRDSSTLNTT